MRPDEHKKKKSAQYNKKKAAKDGRKDSKSAVGSGKGDQTNRTPVNSKVQQQHTTASSAPARSSDSSDTEEPTVTKQRPTFKRREIVSNWNRYEITEGDSDSLVQPLPDYSKLLSSAGGASSHFRFKDEADWEGDLSSTTEDTQMTSAFDLDLTDLGEAMQSIPLYERLSVPLGLFTEEQKIEMRRVADACGVEYGSMRDVDYAERLAPEAGDTCESIASVNNSHSGNPSGNRVCSTSSELGQDVNTLNSLNKDDTNKESTLCTLDCKAVSPHESFSEQANRKERSSEQRKVLSEQMKSVQQSKDVNKQSGVHRVLTTPHQEEELDILLSIGETNSSTTTLDPSVSRQHESTSDRLNSKLSDSCKDEGNSCRRQPDLLVNSPGNSQVHQHKTDPLVEKKPELENLEDWLDSILDD